MLQEDLETQKEEYTPAVNVYLFIIIICKNTSILNIWNLLKNVDRDRHDDQRTNPEFTRKWIWTWIPHDYLYTMYHEKMNFKITMVQKWINQMKKEKI